MWVIHSCIPRIRMIGMSQLPYSLAALRTCTSNSALAAAHMTAAAPLRFCSQEGARKLHAGRVAMMLNHMIIIIILLSYWIWYSGKFMNIQTFRLQNGLIQNIQWKIWSTHYGSSEPLELVPGLPAPYASQHPPKSAPYCDPRVLWCIAFGISIMLERWQTSGDTQPATIQKATKTKQWLGWNPWNPLVLDGLRILRSWVVRKSFALTCKTFWDRLMRLVNQMDRSLESPWLRLSSKLAKEMFAPGDWPPPHACHKARRKMSLGSLGRNENWTARKDEDWIGLGMLRARDGLLM